MTCPGCKTTLFAFEVARLRQRGKHKCTECGTVMVLDQRV